MFKVLNFLTNNFRLVTICFLFIPIVINIIFILLPLDFTLENMLPLILASILFYFTLIFSLLIFTKINQGSPIRSCFDFVRRLNTTGNSEYWDEYKQPLRHLIGAEVGVYKGDNSEALLKNLNFRKLYLIDPWAEYFDVVTGVLQEKSKYEKIYQSVKKRFENNNKIDLVRDYSIKASKNFDDNYFDFVYIDGDHAYEEVLQDLIAWFPKVKENGVLCGDDYGHPSGVGVVKAVNEFAQNNKITVHYGDDCQFWLIKS